MTAFWTVSCVDLSEDVDPTMEDGAIVLHFQTPGVAVKGTIEDNACESYMSHLDVLIYEYENSSYTPFHYERISVSATPQGTVSLHKTKNDFKENAEYITLISVKKLVGIFLVLSVVLAEYEIFQTLVIVNDREGVYFVCPYNIVGFVKAYTVFSGYQLRKRSHEVFNLLVHGIAAWTIVSTCNHSQKFAIGCTIVGNAYGREAGFGFQFNNILQCVFGCKIGIADNETCFIFLYFAYHFGLAFDGLGTVYKRKSTVFCQCYGHV